MLDFQGPYFWRQLATYVVGAAFVGVPIFVPALAPVAPYLVPLGASMLGVAGTKFLRPSPPPLLPQNERKTTPPTGQGPGA